MLYYLLHVVIYGHITPEYGNSQFITVLNENLTPLLPVDVPETAILRTALMVVPGPWTHGNWSYKRRTLNGLSYWVRNVREPMGNAPDDSSANGPQPGGVYRAPPFGVRREMPIPGDIFM
jgi:hypothetical protein